MAAHHLVMDAPVPELNPYAVSDRSVPEGPAITLPWSSMNVVYRGPGWLARRWHDVECRSGPDGYGLRIANIGCCSVAANGTWVSLSDWNDGQPGLMVEGLLLPALVLALALHNTWCLHASAVDVMDHAIVFVGESGQGKSTLANYLNEQHDQKWARLVDDILPVVISQTGLEALPHFPQLNLPPADQPVVSQPARLPVAAIYVLTQPEPGQNKVRIEPLTAREATLALVHHTMAARLFDRHLLARHFRWCSWTADRIPVYRLIYPRRHDALPDLRCVLMASLIALLDSERGRRSPVQPELTVAGGQSPVK